MKNRKTSLVLNFLLATGLILILIKENYPQKIMSKINSSDNFNNKESYRDTDEYRHELSLYNVYQKKGEIVMLGNSITYRVNWNELLGRDDVINRGIGKDITQGFIDRLQTVIVVEAKLCFIMGGINDIFKGADSKDIVTNLETICKLLRENGTEPILNSILYVSSDYPEFTSINMQVKKTNKLIKQLCDKESIEYINLNNHFAENYFLKKEFSFDGIHLTAKAYKKWGELITASIETYNIE